MLTCKLDSEEFADRESATEHIRNQHFDLVNDVLAEEFIFEAEEKVFEDQIEEEE